MTVPWSMTVTAGERVRTITGIADDQAVAAAAVLGAARADAADTHARGAAASRYELRAGDALVAIIQAGADHAGTAALFDRLTAQHRADGSLGRVASGGPAGPPLGAGLSDLAGHH